MNTDLLRAPWLIAVARAFSDAGEPLFAVGGAVRNGLMDLPASDVDLCGPARPQRVAGLCEGTPVRAVLRAAHFGTVELHVSDGQGRHMAEYTTFRVDSYRGGHQPVAVRFADTAEVDALRRDFSVNALYRPLHPDPDAPAAVIDPTGGLDHLRRRVLHTVTYDPDQVLKDDGLRILRAARFQAELGLQPTAALLASARKFAPILRDIAPERIRDELTRLLMSDRKYPMLEHATPPVASGLGTVADTGAWPYVFGPLAPNVRALAALAQYRAPDGLAETAGRMALLFFREDAAVLGERMRQLRFSAVDAAAAEAALRTTRRIAENALGLMEALRVGPILMEHAARALTALAAAGEDCLPAVERAGSILLDMKRAGMPQTLRELAVHGDDLLALCERLRAPRSRIGQTLDALWRETVEGNIANEKPALLAYAESLLRGAATGDNRPEEPAAGRTAGRP
ncbi:MAG: CCA tRNA nucleotidyltransferase [Clostridiales bacterium]|nr:CCA tRNA nucleotidyltransferase [Clostridiales bacterium]